jgi:Na+/glutamate symporter
MNQIQKAISIKEQPRVKKFLPAMVLIPSFYYSFYFTSGIIIGYVISKFFYNYFVEKGKVDCMFLDWGKWQIHLHHWIMGVAVLAFAWVLDYFYLPAFFAGFVIGIIIHDIYDFNDWYKIILKKETIKK